MQTKVQVLFSKKHQKMESFGVSGAWWAQLVGGWKNAEEIAELLFSKEKGIGITNYRYNIGGGSMVNGKSCFSCQDRGAESFDKPDGGYDWSRDKNAVNMMKLAVKHGADEVVLFVNSPPVSMTINGKAYCSRPGAKNLAPENYLKFTKYCLDVTEHFVDEGLPVKYLSPVNEPVWIWCESNGQEGCHYMPRDVKKLFKVFAEEIEKRQSLKAVKLAGTECGDLRWFNKSFSRAVLSDEKVRRNLDSVDFHSYFLHPVKPFFSDRVAYLKRYKKFHEKHYPGIKIKMTEWTHMEGGRDYGINSALVQATTMFEDINYADVTSWSHWVALSYVDYNDGIIYFDQDKKTYEITKRYYAFGNFTKYIERDSVRLEVEQADKDLKILCFENGKKYTFIVINNTDTNKQICLSDFGGEAKIITTSADKNLAEATANSKSIAIDKKSVNTIIIGG